MRISKIIFNIIIVIIAFTCFILWYEKTEKDVIQTSVTPIQHYKIYLITPDKQYEYWGFLNNGAADMAKMSGVNYFWDAPKERSADEQIDVLNRAVDDGANAILIAVYDSKKLAGPIEDAKARGVKIVYVDSPSDEEAVITLATDNLAAGQMAGRTMISELNQLGITEGELGIIGVTTNYDIAMAREKGFREIIEQNSKFKILNTVYAGGDPQASQNAAQEMITNNKNLVGLFAPNEGSTQGIGDAIQNTNSKIIGIGFNASNKNLKLLNDGFLNALLVQNPYTMGYLGMAEAIAALKGYNTGPNYINTGVSILQRR